MVIAGRHSFCSRLFAPTSTPHRWTCKACCDGSLVPKSQFPRRCHSSAPWPKPESEMLMPLALWELTTLLPPCRTNLSGKSEVSLRVQPRYQLKSGFHGRVQARNVASRTLLLRGGGAACKKTFCSGAFELTHLCAWKHLNPILRMFRASRFIDGWFLRA